jgi:uncharacterized protein YutE (UPF0331/DUF86 family)
MSPDAGRVQGRLAFIEGQVAELRAAFARLTPDELARPERALERGGVKYAVQTAAEAVADVAYHLCARQWRHAPQDPHDALDFLRGKGPLPPNRLPAWHALMGTRNRLVHGDLDVSEERFLREAREGLDDLSAFVAAVAEWLDREGVLDGASKAGFRSRLARRVVVGLDAARDLLWSCAATGPTMAPRRHTVRARSLRCAPRPRRVPPGRARVGSPSPPGRIPHVERTPGGDAPIGRRSQAAAGHTVSPRRGWPRPTASNRTVRPGGWEPFLSSRCRTVQSRTVFRAHAEHPCRVFHRNWLVHAPISANGGLEINDTELT